MNKTVKLPAPQTAGSVSLEEAISRRRSIRTYSSKTLTKEQISQLLWAGQGITDAENGFRTAPSAGAIYPFRLYIVSAEGLFRYDPGDHSLELIREGDMRALAASAAFGQDFLAAAALTVVITVSYGAIQEHYGVRGKSYADMEAGHIAQNIHLQAEAMGLGSVPVGAFSAKDIRESLGIDGKYEPVYLVCAGYRARGGMDVTT